MSSLLSSSSVPTTNTTHSTDGTSKTVAISSPTTAGVITSDFMKYLPLEIRMEIYSLIDDIKEPYSFFDDDSKHDDFFDDDSQQDDFFNDDSQHDDSYDILKPEINIAAIINDMEALHMLLPQITEEFFKYEATRILARHGCLTVLQWYCQRYRIKLQDDFYECAALGGHRHIIQWFMQQNSRVSSMETSKQTKSRGNFKLFKWFTLQCWCSKEQNTHAIDDSCESAAYGDHRHMSRWIQQRFRRRGGIFKNTKICANAALDGHFQLLKWLRKQGFPWDELTCSSAARNGHLDILRFAHEHRCPWDKWTCSSAAENGHFEVLRYAHEQRCPWDKWTCSSAAENGHFEVLRYAHEHRCPWDQLTCSSAAANCHLDILRFAHEHGCPWDTWTCSSAALYGHLDILRYAHEHGCPWDTWTCSSAAANGHLDILRYAHEHGCPWDSSTIFRAMVNGHEHILQWARENIGQRVEGEDEEED